MGVGHGGADHGAAFGYSVAVIVRDGACAASGQRLPRGSVHVAPDAAIAAMVEAGDAIALQNDVHQAIAARFWPGDGERFDVFWKRVVAANPFVTALHGRAKSAGWLTYTLATYGQRNSPSGAVLRHIPGRGCWTPGADYRWSQWIDGKAPPASGSPDRDTATLLEFVYLRWVVGFARWLRAELVRGRIIAASVAMGQDSAAGLRDHAPAEWEAVEEIDFANGTAHWGASRRVSALRFKVPELAEVVAAWGGSLAEKLDASEAATPPARRNVSIPRAPDDNRELTTEKLKLFRTLCAIYEFPENSRNERLPRRSWGKGSRRELALRAGLLVVPAKSPARVDGGGKVTDSWLADRIGDFFGELGGMGLFSKKRRPPDVETWTAMILLTGVAGHVMRDRKSGEIVNLDAIVALVHCRMTDTLGEARQRAEREFDTPGLDEVRTAVVDLLPKRPLKMTGVNVRRARVWMPAWPVVEEGPPWAEWFRGQAQN